MAVKGEWTSSNELTHKYWEPSLSRDIISKNPFDAFMGDGDNYPICLKTDLTKNPGDKITFGMGNLYQGRGVTGFDTLEGKTEALTTRYDSLEINALAHGGEYPGRLVEQRNGFSMRAEVRNGLSDWGSGRIAQGMMLHAAGVTGQFVDYASGETLWAHEEGAGGTTPSPYVLSNAVRAPATGRVMRAGGRSDDQSLQSTDVFSLNLIAKARTIVQRSRPRSRPITAGRAKAVCIIHPEQEQQLVTEAGGLWEKIQLAALSAKDSTDNPMYTEAVGLYRDTLILVSDHVPCGNHSSTGALVGTSRRAVFLTGQALTFAYGKDSGRNSTWSWFEEKFDVGRKWRCSIEALLGCVKTQYKLSTNANDKTDYGAIVISTYAAA